MPKNILVIEDDPSILMGLRMNLTRVGYRVRTALDGQRGQEELARERPDLVILDLMLPFVDGLEILNGVRATDPTLPVLVLTALGAERDKVRGLDLGATDYITKPFSIAELLARIRAALRTATANEPEPVEVLRAGSIELEVESRRIRVEGQVIELGAREYELLHFLMTHPERVITRDQILTALWPDDYKGTARTVDNVVSSLRHKLGEERMKRHLSTIWGIGYRFVP